MVDLINYLNITFTADVRTETKLTLSTVNRTNTFSDVGTVIFTDSRN